MIRLDAISKAFGEKLVLDKVSAEIPRGKIFTIIGPSGQGKTTLLRLINLLDTPTRGMIYFDGKSLHEQSQDVTALRRRMGMVFQTPIAFKDTVFANIAVGLRYRGIARDEIEKRVYQKLDEIGLSGYENRKAGTLSGGEMQRVSLARVMVTEPDLLLLDEPTANLDPLSTSKIEELIRYYNRKQGTTVIMSSHDLFQGQRMADMIAVMMGGRFIQTDETVKVFSEPCSADVARFIGIQNVLSGHVTGREDGMMRVDLGGVTVLAMNTLPDDRVIVAIRPEDITLYNEPDGKMSARNVISGTITGIRPYGIISHVMVACGQIVLAVQVTWQAVRDMSLTPGQEVILSFKAPSVHVMPDDESSSGQF
ncbi:MAG: ABC transporter ATP-binding protein [Methanospirillum sp.]|uniref:ABC transporter ATP-binding protein n=1 Tax=Methanospirillum sp. TaxID=45200 RepID=UPI002374BA24|nr:ABC transporter ATP-binding protein [Methanospirillum sp.]MDD1728818.1 ABC transporter ATP-binding protein [Methanospirillum sp.]